MMIDLDRPETPAVTPRRSGRSWRLLLVVACALIAGSASAGPSDVPLAISARLPTLDYDVICSGVIGGSFTLIDPSTGRVVRTVTCS